MPAQEEKQKSTLKPEGVDSKRKYKPEKDLFTWIAPARPFKRRNKEFYVTIVAIAAVVGLILFLVEGFMPVILIISLVFLFYILSTVEPENIEYKITNKGIEVAGKRTDWNIFLRFWFSRRFDSELLVVETLSLPGRLELVVKPEDKEGIRKNLLRYMPEEKTPPSALDKAANWFSKKLPGNQRP